MLQSTSKSRIKRWQQLARQAFSQAAALHGSHSRGHCASIFAYTGYSCSKGLKASTQLTSKLRQLSALCLSHSIHRISTNSSEAAFEGKQPRRQRIGHVSSHTPSQGIEAGDGAL